MNFTCNINGTEWRFSIKDQMFDENLVIFSSQEIGTVTWENHSIKTYPAEGTELTCNHTTYAKECVNFEEKWSFR